MVSALFVGVTGACIVVQKLLTVFARRTFLDVVLRCCVISRTVESVTVVLFKCVLVAVGGWGVGCRVRVLEAARFLKLRQRFLISIISIYLLPHNKDVHIKHTLSYLQTLLFDTAPDAVYTVNIVIFIRIILTLSFQLSRVTLLLMNKYVHSFKNAFLSAS
jgi:hypothetical protein